jgi:uncharacterized membrane protein
VPGDDAAPAAGERQGTRQRSSAALAPFISATLRIGVLTSAALVVIGFLSFVLTGRSGYPAGSYPHTPAEVLHGLVQARPFAVIDFGLFLLVLTPVFMVAVSIVGFLWEGDADMAAAAGFVLLMLLLSFVLGKAGG